MNKTNHENISFVFNVFTIITQNVNLFSLDRKFQNQQDQKMVYILWEKCVPNKFDKHIFQKEHFMFLNELHVSHYKREEIVTNMRQQVILSFFLAYFQIYNFICQYVFSVLFKYFINNVKRGIDIRAHFMLYFKEWMDDQKILGEPADQNKNRKEEVFELE